MQTKVLTAHIPIELAEKIDDFAISMERSRGWIVKQALADWVEQAESQEQRRPGGFAEASPGFEAASDREAARKAVESLKKLRKTTTLGDISWVELRDAGRR